MRRCFVILFLVSVVACNKTIEVELPEYHPELAVEMYIEDGQPLRCLLSESLDYNNASINKLQRNAIVIFSDGFRQDTLLPGELHDWETGRFYNFFHPRKVYADPSKTYTLKIMQGKNRLITGETKFAKKTFGFDSIVSRPSPDISSRYSVGVKISDRGGVPNYYRILITKRLNDFVSEPTDLLVPDISFDGKQYSMFSDASYAAGDTVLARVYELSKAHFEFMQSVDNARRANYNLLTQPAAVVSNVTGGIGIFSATIYDEKKIIVR